MVRKIVCTPSEGSRFTGMLSGIYYVEGCQVTEEQFRQDVIRRGVEKMVEMREMDIVKRAYLQTMEGWPKNAEAISFEATVREEIKRLIRVRVYSSRDWLRELGPLPDELRSKRNK